MGVWGYAPENFSEINVKIAHFGAIKLKWSLLQWRQGRIGIKIYTVSGKKGTNSILGITSSNIDRFSKFFQCHNLLEICNKTVIKFPTTLQTRRYTTL